MISIAIVALALAASNPQAQARIQEQQDLIAQLNKLGDEKKALEADEARLAKRWDDLKWSNEQIKKKVEQYKNDVSQLNQAQAAHEAEAAAHNARCTGTFNDRGFVDACNAAAARGNANKARLESQARSLNQTRDLLNQAIQTQTEETQKVFAAHKAHVARIEEIVAKARPMIERLKAIQAEVDKCKAAIKRGTDENMHDRCGEMFDGNR